MLIDAGADVNVADADGSRPLHGASAFGHVDVLRILVAAGADKRATDGDGQTAADVYGTGVEEDRLEALAPIKVGESGNRV